LLLERLCPARDLDDLRRDGRLTRLIIDHREIFGKLGRVIRRVLHRHAPRRVLGCVRFENRVVQPDLEQFRCKFIKHFLRRWLDDIFLHFPVIKVSDFA